MLDKWVNQSEVARRFGKDDSTISKWRSQSDNDYIEVKGVKIEYTKFGGQWLFDKVSVELVQKKMGFAPSNDRTDDRSSETA